MPNPTHLEHQALLLASTQAALALQYLMACTAPKVNISRQHKSHQFERKWMFMRYQPDLMVVLEDLVDVRVLVNPWRPKLRESGYGSCCGHVFMSNHPIGQHVSCMRTIYSDFLMAYFGNGLPCQHETRQAIFLSAPVLLKPCVQWTSMCCGGSWLIC